MEITPNPALINSLAQVYRAAFMLICQEMMSWSCPCDWSATLPRPYCPTCGADDETMVTDTWEDHGTIVTVSDPKLSSPMARMEGVKPMNHPDWSSYFVEDVRVDAGFYAPGENPDRFMGHTCEDVNGRPGCHRSRTGAEIDGDIWPIKCDPNWEQAGELFVGRFFVTYHAFDRDREYLADYGVYEGEDGTVRVSCWNS